MTNIIKGNLLTSDRNDNVMEKVGEYWTPEHEYYVVCISYMGQLLSMDKAWFRDWLQLNHLLYDELIAKEVWGSCFDPYDVGMDVE